MADTALLAAWKRFSTNNRNLQQFGQSDDESTFNGATGCTHTVLQRLVKAKTGVYYSHDRISSIAGYPTAANNPGRRGMYPSEVQRVVNHFGLPYRYKSNPTWTEIVDGMKRGPVLVGIIYGYWPEWVGYKYGGTKADGKPGGYAYRNGKTQLTGFEKGRHAVLFLGRKTVDGVWRIIANEPNHGSSSRPEKPDWDVVRSAYARRAWEQFSTSGTRFAWLPTTTFKPKGY